MLAGTETFEGERTWGHNVDESFYAQHQLEALNLNNTILEEMMLCGSGKTELELRSLLGCFLFSGDEVEKKIRVLSGGEKARVALAKVIAGKANFLLLDEPTNHLDIHSVELLSEALNKYEGSYILVSHDRYFVSKTANKIWEIVDHEIKEFKGNYEEYVAWKERMAKNASRESAQERDRSSNVKREASSVNDKPAEKQSTQTEKPKAQNFDQQKDLQKLQKQFSKAEAHLNELNQQKTNIEAELANPEFYADRNKFVELEERYKTVKQKLIAANKEYELLFEKIMQAE